MSDHSPWNLNGKLAIVTGASRGIGQAVAHKLGALGATVVGTATSAAGREAIAAQLAEKGYQGGALVLDVSDRASVQQFVADVAEMHDGAPAILVNNAGITRDQLCLRMSDDDWEAVITTNLSGAFYLTRAVLKPMMKARFGRIVNISSVVGRMGNAGQVNYSAAKAGMEGMTRTLAKELGSRNITVNAVAPGFIETDMTKALGDKQREALEGQIPLGRLGDAEDVANAVAFLAGPGAAYITGAVLPVNGGMYMV